MTDYDYDTDDDCDASAPEEWIYIWRYGDIRLARLAILWALAALTGWLLTRALTS